MRHRSTTLYHVYTVVHMYNVQPHIWPLPSEELLGTNMTSLFIHHHMADENAECQNLIICVHVADVYLSTVRRAEPMQYSTRTQRVSK